MLCWSSSTSRPLRFIQPCWCRPVPYRPSSALDSKRWRMLTYGVPSNSTASKLRPPVTSATSGLPAASKKATRPSASETSAEIPDAATRSLPSASTASNCGAAPSRATRIRLSERSKSPSRSAVTRMMPSDTTCRRTSAVPSAVGRTTRSSPTRSQLVAACAPQPASATATGSASRRGKRESRVMASVLLGVDVGRGAIARKGYAQQLHCVGKIQAVVGLVAVPVALELPGAVDVAAFLDAVVDQRFAFGRGVDAHARMHAGDQELVRTQLGDQRRTDRLGIARHRALEPEMRQAVADRRVPAPVEADGLLRHAGLLCHAVQPSFRRCLRELAHALVDQGEAKRERRDGVRSGAL